MNELQSEIFALQLSAAAGSPQIKRSQYMCVNSFTHMCQYFMHFSKCFGNRSDAFAYATSLVRLRLLLRVQPDVFMVLINSWLC